MEEVAEEASKIFYAGHAAVKSCLGLETIEHDIKLGAMKRFKTSTFGVGSELRHTKVCDAAYENARNVANETAIQHTSENVAKDIQDAYMEFRNNG
jgi:hypothetical protein